MLKARYVCRSCKKQFAVDTEATAEATQPIRCKACGGSATFVGFADSVPEEAAKANWMISARLVLLTAFISTMLALILTTGVFLTGLSVFRYLVPFPILTGVIAVFVGVGAVMIGKIKNDLKS